MCGDKTRANLLKKFNHKCAYCGAALRGHEMTIDHVRPRSKGGIGNFKNLKPSCSFCNAFKASHNLAEFKQKLQEEYKKDTDAGRKIRNKFELKDGKIVFYYETMWKKRFEELKKIITFTAK